jgi:hypothetical protein
VIVKVWKGSVRKKSNQENADTAATTAAVRIPVAAAATTISTSPSAALVFATLSRNSANTAQASSGTSAAAPIISDR